MSKRGKKKLRYQTRTPISGHKKEGRALKPPFVQFGVGKGLVSWTNDRLPEMVWAALLAPPQFPHTTLEPRVRTITHLSPRFLRRSIKTN